MKNIHICAALVAALTAPVFAGTEMAPSGKDMKQMAAVHEVREEYRLKDNPISTTAETLAKQYRAWRAVRTKRTDKG